LISKKRRSFRIFDRSKNDVDREIVELNRNKYQAAKGSVKRATSIALEAERKKFGEKLDEEDKKINVLKSDQTDGKRCCR